MLVEPNGVVGFWRFLDEGVIVINRISFEAVPVIPPLWNGIVVIIGFGFGVCVIIFLAVVVVMMVPVKIFAGIQSRISGGLCVYRQRVVVLLVVLPVLRIAVSLETVVLGQVPVVEILSRQKGRPARTTNGNVYQAAFFKGDSLLLESFVHFGHVRRRVEGTQQNVLVVGQQYQNVGGCCG